MCARRAAAGDLASGQVVLKARAQGQHQLTSRVQRRDHSKEPAATSLSAAMASPVAANAILAATSFIGGIIRDLLDTRKGCSCLAVAVAVNADFGDRSMGMLCGAQRQCALTLSGTREDYIIEEVSGRLTG